MTNTPEPFLSEADRRGLVHVARASIGYGLTHGAPIGVHPGEYSPALRQPRATFVTLKLGMSLRGCIGSLAPRQSLVEDVVQNAFAAAFRDLRFMPLSEVEYYLLGVQISILSEPLPMTFTSEEHLLEQLRPNTDGLILQEGTYRGTFLPSVWETVPRPKDFLAHLKIKAGLPADYWSDTICVLRYTTQCVE